MNYRLTILLAFFLLTYFQLAAQQPSFQLGIKAGGNFSSLAFTDNTIPGHRIKTGISLGLTTTYNVSRHFFLQSGLSLTTKGMKISSTDPIGFPEHTIYPGRETILKSQQVYLQTPLYLGYLFPLSSTTQLFLSAGPYVAYGIGGKTQLTGDIVYGDMIDYSTWAEKTFTDRGLQRLDVGLGTGVGAKFGQTLVGLTYELGLRNIGPTQLGYIPFYNTGYRNRNVVLSVDYRF